MRGGISAGVEQEVKDGTERVWQDKGRNGNGKMSKRGGGRIQH